jgi:RNA polymerase sigma-70 factor (ECF subfamily)
MSTAAMTVNASEVCRMRPYLLRVARSRMGDRIAAEDVVQDTLATACANLGRFEGRSALRSWVTGILLHKVMDVFRSMGREAAAPPGEAREDPDFHPDGSWRERSDPWTDPGLTLDRKRFHQALDAALARLPASQALAFRMRELEEMESAEVCAAMGITEGNLFVLLHRARLKLRLSLDRDWFPARG